MEFFSRQIRFLFLVSLVILCVSSFLQLAPLSYGSMMTYEQCESVGRWFSLLDCSIAPEQDAQVIPLSTLKEQRREEKEELWSLALQQQEGTPTTKQPQATHEPISSHAGPEVDFLTEEAILPASASVLPQTPQQHGSTGLYGSYGQAGTDKLELRKKPPVLEPFFPAANEFQPKQDVVLLPYQISPQHWDLDVLNQMLGRWTNEHALQQVRDLIRKRRQQEEEQQLQQERLEKEVEAGSVQNDLGIKDSSTESLQNESLASVSVDAPPPPPMHTQGMAYPADYEGRPNYQRREQMIAAAAVFAANKKAQARAERDVMLALFPTKDNLAEHKAKEKEEVKRQLQKQKEDLAKNKDKSRRKV